LGETLASKGFTKILKINVCFFRVVWYTFSAAKNAETKIFSFVGEL